MYYNKHIVTNEREIIMSFNLKYLIIVSAILLILIWLIAVILYYFSRSTFYNILAFFVVDNGKTGEHEKILEPKPAPKKHMQKSVSEPLVEVCTLIRKSDDRIRIIESDGSEKVMDAYYELVFMTRKKEELRVACSSEIYFKVPFDVEGSMTYRRNTLVRFKYYKNKKEIIISDVPSDTKTVNVESSEEKIENEGKLVIFNKTIE